MSPEPVLVLALDMVLALVQMRALGKPLVGVSRLGAKVRRILLAPLVDISRAGAKSIIPLQLPGVVLDPAQPPLAQPR